MAVASLSLTSARPGAAGTAAAAVREFIEREGLLEPGQRVLAAFSGGADSTALAIVLKTLGYRVCLGHVNHQMRAEAADEELHCRRAAGALGLGLQVERVKVFPPTEAAARQARYAALEKMAEWAGAARIATGHTAGDEAETVLMRMRRGGLGLGIPSRRGSIVRPLLETGRSSTEALCRDAGISFVNDPSNLDMRFTRNRVRRELAALPGAASAYIARGRAARKAVEESGRKTQALAAAVLASVPGGISVARTAVSALRPGEAAALLKVALQAIGVEPRARYLALLADNLSNPGFSMDLPEGMCAWAEEDDLLFGSKPVVPEMKQASLALPGVTRPEGWGLVFEIDRVAVPDRFSGDPFEAVVDEAVFRPPVSVRARRPGDRFIPLGAPGSRKLQDFFTDAAVPRRSRPCVPIVVSAGSIAWVAGHRIDERFKVTAQTAFAVRIRVRTA